MVALNSKSSSNFMVLDLYTIHIALGKLCLSFSVGTTALLGGLGVAGLGAVTGNTHLRNSGLNVAIAGGATKVLGHLLGKKK